MAAQDVQPLYIDGRPVDATSGETFTVTNPYDGSLLATIGQASQADVDSAVQAAQRGQREWAAMTGMERSRILLRAVALLRERNDELAELETRNTGKPISETASVDIVTGADALEYYAGLAPAIEGHQIPLRDSSFVYTRREPLGVIGAIGAWNYPIQIACWKAAPALAAGNAIVFKPSEVTPLTAMKLADIFTEAGLPNGVFNVVQGDGRVGAMLTEHEGIAKVSFTGEVGTGKKVMAAAGGSTLKDVTMELGGKSPLIVFADADLDRAADAAMMANFYSSGQICTNGTRVFVERSVKEAFEAKLVERVARIKAGDPMDPSVNFGPLVSFEHQEKSALLYRTGQRARRTRAGRWRRVEQRRMGQRRLGGPHGIHRLHRRDACRQRGDLWPGNVSTGLRRRRGSHPSRQRHQIRPGRRRLQRKPEPRAPCDSPVRSRHLLGQYVG